VVPDRVIPVIHYNSAGSKSLQTNNFCMIDPTQFHTYELEWTTTRITISFDGTVCVDHVLNPAAPLTGSQPFDQPFFMALTQTFGIYANGNAPVATTPLPASTYVDYVRVWK
jgi:beta-glucanase (GH16 family)